MKVQSKNLSIILSNYQNMESWEELNVHTNATQCVNVYLYVVLTRLSYKK